MKLKYFLIAAILLPMAFNFGCGAATTSAAAKFTVFNPSVALTASQLASLGADHLDGTTEAETAANILTWQKGRMITASPADRADVSYAMRWNYIMPGIYPVNEMITERTSPESGVNKIYGVCWDFAAVYISVANKYGLTTRMTAWKEYMSGSTEAEKGMGPDEYNALKVKLQQNGLGFSLDQMNAAARETWKHYRAEVWLGAKWVAFDGTNPTGPYLIDSNYTEAAWDEGANSDLTKK